MCCILHVRYGMKRSYRILLKKVTVVIILVMVAGLVVAVMAAKAVVMNVTC